MRKFYLKALGILGLNLFALSVSAQTTYYVKTDGTGTAATATGWSTASKDLQDVINIAQAGDKIFVAMGTYLPNRPANNLTTIDAANRDNAFVLKNGVSIYGGFVGNEANETQRTAGNKTTLSGDLNGDDVAETTVNTNTYMTEFKSDNTYHVVIALGLSDVVFDGFTVTRGDASDGSGTTITVDTKAVDRRYGGAFYILDCGAGFKISSVTATINRAVGDGSTGAATGAGLYVFNSSPTIENCEISKSFNTNSTPKSTASNYGSAISLLSKSNPQIIKTIISENFAAYGAGVSINGSSPEFTNCTFLNNRVISGRGGAIDIRGGFPIFTNCLFSGNRATGTGGGGGVYNYSGRPTFVNCIFYKNTTATGNGAAFGSNSNNNHGAVFINNTFYDNQNDFGTATGTYSSGIFVSAVGSNADYQEKGTFLYNNIFFSNKAPYNTNKSTIDIYVADAALIGAFNNNIIQQTTYPVGTGNQANANPLFISVVPTHLAFLAPGNNSPAKDAGSDSDNTSLIDFNGRARKNGAIDIGAVEFHTVLPVSFIGFTAKTITNGVQLNWKVGSETNNKQYIISRSVDGENYSLVTKIAGKINSAEPLSYSYTDQTVNGGNYYYKLEQEDLNGEINYLATQVVKIDLAGGSINVYPNPTAGKITVALTTGGYSKYSVINLQGTAVLQGSIHKADQQVSLNLTGLAKGTYIIKLTGIAGNEFSRVIKF
ncbi:T9SS type A sorting domain-containing protein [Pedobacter xixiisoli]|uniref:Por secretion system C-terminal sorting domain-containing protein n=1 Tax=Pedobacter xixiisoli TaxID=1476464 RepID=A0A285ZQ91_9SPHI|nr:T9SS type A sorting domain-containing protein [Pedobacter xixiisoli]SOD11821.1 Por secretion system C-terminal sorting domain-containing protein [Pedobacter xixiisoli]